MMCPAGCQTPLVMAERTGIEIDYCPSCRGVWLDRGELDKIIERSSAPVSGSAAPPDRGYRPPDGYRYGGHDDRSRPEGGHERKKKRGGMLSELFDF